MSKPSFDEIAKQMADEIVADTKKELSDAWNLLITSQQNTLMTAATRVSELTLRSLAGEDVQDQLTVVKATVKNIAVAGQILTATAAIKAFWNAVEKVGAVLAQFLTTVAKSAIGTGL